ncbi:MAG: UDP-N-acetylmuramate dehydrogenase [Candidatus Nanopelagicales bacterium]
MHVQTEVPLADYTSLRLGGPAARLLEADIEDDVIAAVQEADRDREDLLVLGGGSNIVVGDIGFPATVVRVGTRGVRVESDQCAGAFVRVQAGEDWEALVARAVDEGWVGVEALSGIPGLVGATPIQNVGAYGQEVADTIAQVRTWDRVLSRFATFATGDCGFGYRTSMFKRAPARWVVLEVTFQFLQGELSPPIRYAELARTLGVGIGDRAPTKEVREAVLDLRRGKGMVLDPQDPDTRSAGSFFMNPVLPARQADALPKDAPRFPVADSMVKTSAAWLIEQAGFTRGHGGPRARISSKHTLALTTRDGATTNDLLTLAREVRSGVVDRFGIELQPEPVLVQCAL